MTNPIRPVPALPNPYSVDDVINRILTVAISQDGYREGRDNSGWNNDNAFGVWYPMNYASWCAMFVSWCAWRAGIPESVIYKHAYTPYGWKWFQDHGRAVATPKRGDIFYVYSPSMGVVHHIGLVDSVGNGVIRTVEGNTNTSGAVQGDGVHRLTRPINSNLKFARPNYAACVVAGAPGKPVLPKNATLVQQARFDLQSAAYYTKVPAYKAQIEKALAVLPQR